MENLKKIVAGCNLEVCLFYKLNVMGSTCIIDYDICKI